MSNTETPVRADQIAQIIGAGPQAAAPPAAPAPEVPAAGAIPPEPPVAGTPPVEPEFYDRNYVENLRREAATERAQAWAGLQGTNRTAVEVFARAVAEGNDEAIDNWLMQVAQHRGLAFGEPEPEPQTPYGGVAPPPAPGQPLTREEVERIADERAAQARAEWEDQQRADAARARIDAAFADLGVPANHPAAASLRSLGAQLSTERGVFVPPAEVFEIWKSQVAPLVGGAPSAVPGQVPPVAPVGVPAHIDNYANMKPEERALARLTAAQQRAV